MAKILIIGNETSDTDNQVSLIAKNNNSINHGLIVDPLFIPKLDGYYHTTVVDIPSGSIALMSKYFDQVVMLDQDFDSYPHFKSLVTTIRLMYDLELDGINVEYKENKTAKNLLYWRNLLKENKSFCFYPFATLIVDNDVTHMCEKTSTIVTNFADITDWQSNEAYNAIRSKMLEGLPVPACRDCYRRENDGQESMRQFETLEWAVRLQANSVQDFAKIQDPIYYEIRPSNKCNILCRTCDDDHSHLIQKEWKSIGIPINPVQKYQNTDPFKQINFNSAQRIYIGGGEPTIMPEFYNFLRKCIDEGKTDIEINIGTNGMKFSNKLISLLDHFSDLCFSVSFDGYKKINDYIRWGSNFDTIVDNTRMLRERGHKISLQTVFSIYNLTRIHEIFEFYDKEFSDPSCLVNAAGGAVGDYVSLHNHPRPDLIVESMKRCQDTKVYYSNGRSIKSMVDLTLNYYSDPNYKVDTCKLEKFYQFNNKLDKSRGSNLKDYIPELADGCKLYLPNSL